LNRELLRNTQQLSFFTMQTHIKNRMRPLAGKTGNDAQKLYVYLHLPVFVVL